MMARHLLLSPAGKAGSSYLAESRKEAVVEEEDGPAAASAGAGAAAAAVEAEGSPSTEQSVSLSARASAPSASAAAAAAEMSTQEVRLREAGIPTALLKRFAGDLPNAILWFEQMDADQDGSLTCAEFSKGLVQYGIPEDTARRIFEAIDVKNTSRIELHELIDIAANIREKRNAMEYGRGHNSSRLSANSTTGQKLSEELAEYLLSFFWRSVPNLAAETQSAAASIGANGGNSKMMRPLTGPDAVSEGAAQAAADAAAASDPTKDHAMKDAREAAEGVAEQGRASAAVARASVARKSVAEMRGGAATTPRGGGGWNKFISRVSSGGPVYGSSADNLSMYRAQDGEAEQAAVMKHSLKIERAVGKAEDDLFRAVEKAVGDVEGIAERIRQFRLRMLLTQATYRRATRTKRTARLLADHYAFTDMLWRSLQGSLARLKPLRAKSEWNLIAPLPEVETNLRRAACLCAFVLFMVAVAFFTWAYYFHLQGPDAHTLLLGVRGGGGSGLTGLDVDVCNGTTGLVQYGNASFLCGPQPLNVFMCTSDSEYEWEGKPGFNAFLTIVALFLCLAITVLVTRKNVYWIGIAYGYLHPTNAVLPLISTLVRTIVLLRAYVLFADQQGRPPSACVTVSVGLTLSYLLLFLAFVVSDMWRAPAPMLRLCLATIIAFYLVFEVYMRTTMTVGWEEQEPTAIEGLDGLIKMVWGGESAHDLVLNCDRTVLLLMLSAFRSTLMRPNECAMTVVPASLSTIKFFYYAEYQNRLIHGRNRLKKAKYTWEYLQRRCLGRGRAARMYDTVTGESFHDETVEPIRASVVDHDSGAEGGGGGGDTGLDRTRSLAMTLKRASLFAVEAPQAAIRALVNTRGGDARPTSPSASTVSSTSSHAPAGGSFSSSSIPADEGAAAARTAQVATPASLASSLHGREASQRWKARMPNLIQRAKLRK